jgi:hypothetical protein
MTKAIVTAGTLNVLYSNTPTQIENDIKKVIGAGADIIGCQEFGGLANQAALRRLPAGWKHYSPRHPDDASNPIVWDSRKVTKVWAKFQVYSSRHNIDNGGPGPSVYPPRTACVSLFEINKTKQRFIFINCHTVPSSMGANGKPRWDPIRKSGDASKRGRCEMAMEQFANLRDIVLEYRGRFPVVLVGDVNIDYRLDRQAKHEIYGYNRLGRQANCWPTWELIGFVPGGTHGPAKHIDWICVSDDKRTKARRHRTVSINSDHDGVVAGLEFDSKATYEERGPAVDPDEPGNEGKDPEPKPNKPAEEKAPWTPPEVVFPDQCV